jgi:NADH dehydrogenase
LRAQYQQEPLQPGQLNIAIIGAGATGVELAAELHYAVRRLVTYGLDNISPDRDVRLILIEATDEVLPSLPKRVARDTRKHLQRLGVEIHTGRPVIEVTPQGVQLQEGPFLLAQMKVWTAGIKAPAFLNDLDGLETNRLNQLVVHDTLETTRDEHIFAMGDCAFIPQGNSAEPVPPRAQAAHQEASLLARSLESRLRGASLLPYVHKDHGSFISLSGYTAIGSLMGNLMGTLTVEGRLARLVYRSLYRMHQVALLGLIRTFFIVLSDVITRRTRPRLKLH